MDNIKLNKEQLFVVKEFIEKRGFSDPAVVLEILDHFACKIEEIMTAKVNLSLEEALIAAHKSFGIKGFYPLAEAYDKSLKARYMAIYKANLQKIGRSLLFVSCLLIAGIIFWFGYRWSAVNNNRHILGFNDMVSFLFICLLAFRAFLSELFFDKGGSIFRSNMIKGAAYQSSWLGSILLIFGFPNVQVSQTDFAASLSTLFFLIIMTSEIAHFLTVKEAGKESNSIKSLYRKMFG